MIRAAGNRPRAALARRDGQERLGPPAALPRLEEPPSVTMTTSEPVASAFAVFGSGASNPAKPSGIGHAGAGPAADRRRG